MIPSVAALFVEAEEPTHCGKKDVLAGCRQVVAVVASSQAQSARNRALLGDAELDPELPDAWRSKLNQLSGTETAVEKAATAALTALRALTTATVQREREWAEAKKDLEAWEKKRVR